MLQTTNAPTAANDSRRLAADPALWAVVAIAAMTGLLAIALPEFRELIEVMWALFGHATLMAAGWVLITLGASWVAGRYMRPISPRTHAGAIVTVSAVTFTVVTATIVYAMVCGGFAPLIIPGVIVSMGLMTTLGATFALPVRDTDEA
jgi:hypothetical protein